MSSTENHLQDDEQLSERQKRDLGMWYDANNDRDAIAERAVARELTYDLNHTRPSEEAKRNEILHKLFAHYGGGTQLLPPFQCDCGYTISIGEESFVNYGAYFMDGGQITIGDHVYIGPNCGLYTAQHPLRWQERNPGLERALPITIGDNCWLGGDVTVLPGVTIGEGCVIGAGSVVTRDIPAGMLAYGSPCKPIRPITEKDSIYKEV